MNETFKPGDTVYSPAGEQMEYVARALDGHVVRPVIDFGENEPDFGPPDLLAKVYATPPTARYEADTAKAREQLAKAQDDLRAVQEATRALESDREAIMAKLKKQPDLSVVVDWLEGKLTHVAEIPRYGDITIKPVAEAILPKNADDRRNGEVRLLALYGGLSGSGAYRDNFQWKLNAYRDGSGDNAVCILGTSEEDVKQRLQVWLDAEWKRTNHGGESVRYAEDAIKLGLTVPPRLVELVAERQKSAVKHRLQQSRADLQRVQANVVSLTETIRALEAEQAGATA